MCRGPGSRSSAWPADPVRGPTPASGALAISRWLLACAATVFATLVVGGTTRLTHSGLSIADWRPVTGVLPPLSDTDWQAEFARYRQTPEFRKVNAGISLEGFKRIYAWEYVHRLVARLNGIVFAVPLLVFAWRGWVPRALWPSLAALFLAGAAQGALGWYMVRSGLVDEPRVSPLRLTAHLTLAFAVFAGLVWLALVLRRAPGAAVARPARPVWALLAALSLMVVTGGLVAAARAGQVFNTFPLMDGHLLPPALYVGRPSWHDLIANPATLQFHHRTVAVVSLVLALAVARGASGVGAPARQAAQVLLVAVAIQIGIGALTVVHAVPVALGVAHQAGAMVVLGLALRALHAWRATVPR